jgi:deoxyribose-phosphate aldolase
LEVIGLITDFIGNALKVKAAGGVRDLSTLLKMQRMGVARFGINQNSAVDIIEECRALY